MMVKGKGECAVPLEDGAEELLATVAHELRAPLNAIAGWAHLLECGALSPDKGPRMGKLVGHCISLRGRMT
jgi:signal transduction histidine kinase